METTSSTRSTATVSGAVSSTTAAATGTVASPGTIAPVTQVEAAKILDPVHLVNAATIKAELEAWLGSGRALLDRFTSMIHDTARK